jgi:hypothetical protein
MCNMGDRIVKSSALGSARISRDLHILCVRWTALFRRGWHRRIGLGCPRGAEHGDGGIRYDAGDNPAHQREVIAERLNERESRDRADDSAEREPTASCKRD